MRPAVLIVDPNAVRRGDLSRGLAEHGYEVVPATGPEEGLKFAQGLGPSVIVAPVEVIDASILDRFEVRDRAMKRTLVLLGGAADEEEVPEDVLFLPVRGLSHQEVGRRVRLVLVGRELGIEADADLRSLVGELSQTPLLELIRSLHRCLVTGRLEIDDGSITLERGAVVAAAAGRASGVKAFCRLSRKIDGPFRVVLEAPGAARDIDLSVPDLVLQAIEELQIEQPHPGLAIKVLTPTGNEPPSRLQQNLLSVIRGCGCVSDLLDALPATDGRIVRTLQVLQEHGWVRLEKRRVGVAVVTDSTADLPPELARSHDILVVPLSITFGSHTFRDGVDIQPRDFYQMLETEDDHPRTQPPPEAELFEHFYDLIAEQDIVAIHISEKMSQTVEHARRAALRGSRSFDHLAPERYTFGLEVVDSKSVSMGVGLQALFAARMAARGLKVFSIVQRLREMAPRTHVLFAVDTLDYLVRGGRIGKARAWVGKLLGIKPILGVVDGEVTAIDQVRGGRRAYPRIVRLLAERLDPKRPIIASVAHARAPVWADRLRGLIEQRFEVREMIATHIGPVVGTHTGPGCVGCVVFQPNDEEWPLLAVGSTATSEAATGARPESPVPAAMAGASL